MNLNQVEYFVRSAEILSFSRAAQELYVTQQAVSKAVGALEEELGVRLFLRTPGGLELTGAGASALDAARSMLADARALRGCAARGTRPPAGKKLVRLAAADVVVGNFVALDDLISFSRESPDVQLQIAEESSDRCVELVAQGAADLGVVVGRGLGADLRSRRLAEVDFVPFCSPSHPLALLPEVGAADLAEQVFLLPRGASESVAGVRACLFDAGAPMPARSQFSAPDCNLRTLVELVCKGADGVGIIARGSEGAVRACGGVVLPAAPGLIRLPLSAVARPVSCGDALLDGVVGYLSDALGAGAPRG